MGYLDYTGLQYLWGKLKEKFAPKSHSHDDRYYTESEMDGKLNSKVNNNEAGANGLLSKLTTSWTAAPTDDTYFIRQDIGGGNQFGRVKFSTIWNYIKGKTDGIYQPKGSYAASGHTHDDRYYTESEMNTKLSKKAENIVLANDANLNSITTPGFYSCGGGNKITNKPNNTDAIGLIVTHNASGSYYTQILTTSSNANTYRRTCLNGTWSGWTQDKYTDTNTWRGIQNNLTSDSTSDSLSAAQGKALKSLVDGKAPKEHTHTKAQITDFPASLKNPTALTIQTNGATAATYDGSAAKIVNITKGNIGLGNVDNTADKDKSVASAAKLTTARTVSGGSDITLSFNYDGSGNSTANIGFYSCKHLVGNTNNYPFHRFAKLDNLTGAYADRTMLVYITQDYNGGGFGICRLSLRTNNSSSASTVEAKWLVRSGLSADFVQVAIYNVYGKTYADAFIKMNGTYAGTTVRALSSGSRATSGRTWTLVDSNEVNGTTATDKKTSSECWKTIAEAGVAIHEQEYSSSASAIDKGYVASAGSSNTSSSCTGNSASATKLTSSAGSAIQPIYFKDGKPVAGTYTLGDASSKIVRTLGAVGNTGWANKTTDDKYVPTMSFMAYWNGAYSSTSSNLQYCDRGRFGTIVTKGSGDYAVAEHIHLNGTKSGAVDWNTFTTYGVYKIQNCTMDDAHHAPNPEYQFGILQVLDSENNVGEKRILQIYWPHFTSNGNHFWYRMHNSSDINSGWNKWIPIKNKPDTSGVSDVTNALSGFTPRSSQGWGVQTGTFVHGEGDSTGGDFAFRRDCPNAGQVSMVLDGRFYQNEGQYRVLDESDISGIRTRTDTDVGVPLAKSSIDGSVPWSGAGINTDYANSKSMIGSSYDGDQWYNVLSIRHRNGAGDGNNYGMLIFSHLTYLPDTLWYRKQNNAGWTENRNILDSTNYSSYALPLSGGTISGALNFANYTWNRVGDDAYMGDHNIGGAICFIGANDVTKVALCNKDNQGDYAYFGYAGGNILTNKKIEAHTTGHADQDLALSGGTMFGRIIRSGGGSWIGDRDNVAVFGNSYGQSAGYSYNPVVGQKTSSGAWTIGNISGNESLVFNYSTDSNYNAGNNNTTQVYLPAQAGTIITSATISNQTVNTATYSTYVKDIGNSSNTTFAYSKDGMNYANYTWLAGWNGYELRAINKNQFATAEQGVTASGKTGAGIYYVRFGNGTQMCWGFYNQSDHAGSTSFPVAFNNAEYSLSLTITVSSNNAPYITGRSTTGFSYERHGTAFNNIQWIAVGTWK